MSGDVWQSEEADVHGVHEHRRYVLVTAAGRVGDGWKGLQVITGN